MPQEQLDSQRRKSLAAAHGSIHNASRIATISAQIAGDLYRAQLIAKQLALAAQNSRTMVARVGERAAGLDVLSAFFAELSRETIRLSNEVNRLATQVAQNSVAQWRMHRFLAALDQSSALYEQDEFRRFLSSKEEQTEERLRQQAEAFRKSRAGLTDRLQQLDAHMRSASTLAVNFRLEATKTGEYEKNLVAMAADIESRSTQIGEHAKRSIGRLSELRSLDAKQKAF